MIVFRHLAFLLAAFVVPASTLADQAEDIAAILATGDWRSYRSEVPALERMLSETEFVTTVDWVVDDEQIERFIEHFRFVPDEWRHVMIAEFAEFTPLQRQQVVWVFANKADAQGQEALVAATDFFARLQVPDVLGPRILEEARANGADEDWDIPAFVEVLDELRATGDTGFRTLTYIFAVYARVEGQKIPAVRRFLMSAGAAEEARLAAEEARLAAEEAALERAESEARLAAIRDAVAAGNRLIDSLSGASE